MIKRLFDIVFSLLALIVLSPLLLVLALLIRLDSEGQVFYCQTRLGLGAKPFTIYKFRSMVKDAEEENHPQLAHKHDNRITRIGLFLRKYHLDELPQLWNILNGEMSFVGPRPERQFYVDQIIKIEPQYVQLFKVRPGLTSWGMVKYGYASDINQMIERMKYDIKYIDEMSFAFDFKIIILTIKTVITGKGI